MSGNDTQYVRAPFRLAIRAEGPMINAYYAPLDSMDGATLLGSIRRVLLENRPERFDQWRDLMQLTLADACEAAIGTRPLFPEIVPAPEHERSGRA